MTHNKSSINHKAFVQRAVHDLQSALRSITGFSSLIEEAGGVTPQTEKYFKFMRDGAERGQRTLEQITRYSLLLEKEKESEPIPIKDLLEGSRSCHPISVEGENLVVFGNTFLLKQALDQIVENALLYTSEHPEVSIKIKDEGAHALIEISDKGIGIPEDKLEEVFKPFWRFHRYEEYPGSGLGLSLSHEVVKRHQGDIWIQSKEGEGTTVFLRLPKNISKEP